LGGFLFSEVNFMDLLIGTSNPGKLGEFQEMFAGLPLRLLSLKDVGLGDMEVAEDATTLEDNARLKAEAYAKASGLVTLADDTGLFVVALGGAPGVYPARYGGPGLTMAERRAKLMRELAGVADEERTARFECVIAVANPQDGDVQWVKGVAAGRIAQAEAEGTGGFGYDPIFIPHGYDQTFSQLPPEEKNRISHRGIAAALIVPILRAMAEKA
jgi:XTP/dITP diphosphohydrolase